MEALAYACSRGDVPGAVVAVVADRECTGLARAEKLGLQHQVVDPKAFESREEWSEKLRDVVLEHRPDLVVSAGFMRILSPVFVDAFPESLINLHPALLPAFRGAHAVRDAIEAGVKVTGSTIHFVDHQVDHGPIILQAAVPVEEGDTEESLHERIKAAEHELLPRACSLLLEDKIHVEGGRVMAKTG
jgi:phosphoribosylglycinamide formyltransferase-1